MERLRRRTRHALALLVLCLVVPVAVAPAQEARPTVVLEAASPVRPGDTVAIEVRGLTDATDAMLRVEPPGGPGVSVPLRTSPGGARAEVVVTMPGSTVLWLEGPGVEARFVVDVLPALAPAAPAPEAPTSPADAPPAPAPDPEPTPAPADAPAPAATTPPAAAALVVEDGVVVARDAAGAALWRLAFAPRSGEVGTALVHLGQGWVTVGHQVLTLDLANGHVVARVATSGRVVDLRPVGTGLNVVSEVRVTAIGRPTTVEARLADGVLTPPAVFDPHDAMLFGALAYEADVADVGARLAVDATNPYLHLAASRAATTDVERRGSLDAAFAAATTFYDLARLARLLAADRAFADADRAMALAAADFAARGYDPALLTDVAVHDRYGFPLRPLQLATALGDAEAAELWARWTHALSGPDLPGVGSALRAHAAERARLGDADGAAAWRARAAERTSGDVGDLVARAAAALGGAGATASAALLVTLLALHLTLVAKYGRARAVAVRQAREAGRRVPAAPWTRNLRYVDLTEKVVAIGVLAAVVAVVALAGWVQRGDPEVDLLRAGHASAPGLAAVGVDPAADPVARAWVDAYRADRAGDAAAAARALEGSGAARPLAAVATGEAVPTPSPSVLRAAVAGTWSQAVAEAFTDPLRLLDDDARLDAVPRWAWPAVVVAFALVALIHVGSLVVPRPRLARHAPRPWGYHVLALLLPGSGQADELYGLLLLLPWAVVGIDVVSQLLGGPSPFGIGFRAGMIVLGGLYTVNVVAWAVEFGSVRKRLRALREREPDLARAFGLEPLPTTAEDA